MSSHSKRNLIVKGRRTDIREKPPYLGYLSNNYSQDSSIVNTDEDTIKHSYINNGHFNPADNSEPSEYIVNIRDYHNYSGPSLSSMETKVGNNNQSRKSVTFNKYSNNNNYSRHQSNQGFQSLGGEITVGGSPNLCSNKDMLSNNTQTSVNGTSSSLTSGSHNNSPVVNGVVINQDFYESKSRTQTSRNRPKRLEETEWYTRPIHKEYVSSVSPIHKTEGTLGAALVAQQKLDNLQNISHHQDNNSTKDLLDNNTSSSSQHSPTIHHPGDSLARKFFPVTLGASKEILKPFSPDSGNESIISGTLSPPPTGLQGTDSNPWKSHSKSPNSACRAKRPSSGHSSTSSRSRSRRSRPSSAQSSSSSASKSSLDKMYLMAVEAPTIGSPTMLLSSPYQCELARLRMERLRIEEEHLLEVKRQDELERIRGPQPKWYELKGPQFHYEAHKNNELLSNRDSWQTLLDYRGELERASKQFHNAYSATAWST